MAFRLELVFFFALRLGFVYVMCVWINNPEFAEQHANCNLWENGNLHIAKTSISEIWEINLAP